MGLIVIRGKSKEVRLRNNTIDVEFMENCILEFKLKMRIILEVYGSWKIPKYNLGWEYDSWCEV